MEVKQNYTDENYVKLILKYNNQSSSPIANSSLNNLQKDTFEKSVSSDKTENKDDSKKSKWLTKENIIIGATGLALSATVATIGLVRGKGLHRIINNLQSTLTNNQRIINGLNDAIGENQKVIDSLKQKLSKLTELPEDLKRAKEILVERYRKLIDNPTLSYDALNPPMQNTQPESYIIRYAKKIFNIGEITPFSKKAASAPTDIIDTAKLRSTLLSNNVVDISLPTTAKVKPVLSENARIAGLNIPDLGKPVNTDFKLAYGKRVSWSEEKIARDIMQNFYDGHGNTLDGVRVIVKKLPNDQYSIKICGNATFDYENLQFMGSGSKLENPYNAGGFGEGGKVLVTNLLGKGDTTSVRYSCADWELTFDSADGIMRRTLDKAKTPIEGNSIEFTTGNKKLADAVLDSINYFEHSKNPDFQGLDFDSRDFGFRFLSGKDAKGNIYMTQRFEFEKAGEWDKSTGNLDLIFRRKPDPVRFKKITGVDLPKDRDRQFLTFDDIKNYTRYFVHDMSDEDLTRALMTTESEWSQIPKDSKKTALKSFLEAITEEMYDRHIIIDYKNSKCVAITGMPSDAIKNMLDHYGYTPCSDIFYETGMPSAEEIFAKMSIHTPIAPTPDEIKKLKLLEKGIEIIKRDIETALKLHLSRPIFKFKDGLTKEEFVKYMNENDGFLNNTFRETIEKYTAIQNDIFRNPIINSRNLSDEKFVLLKNEIERLMREHIKSIITDRNNAPYRYFQAVEKNYHAKDILDLGTREYYKTYKSFFLINERDVTAPRFIFDRSKELAKDTLGEAIINGDYNGRVYNGHWVDKEYLDTAGFNDLLATWLHEICHKSGGDGTSEFTYTLTDMLRVLLNPSNIKDRNVELAALEEIFNSIGKTAA